jgi:hypothetical protein
MKLWQLRQRWDALAKSDPYYAMLAKAGKQGNKWAIDEFFSTGVDISEEMVALARALGEPGFVA